MLDKSNIRGLLSEALTADVETVLADETSFMGADTARTGALAVGSGPRVPNRFVRHIDGIEIVGGGG